MPNILALLMYIYRNTQQRKVLAGCLLPSWLGQNSCDWVKYYPVCWCPGSSALTPTFVTVSLAVIILLALLTDLLPSSNYGCSQNRVTIRVLPSDLSQNLFQLSCSCFVLTIQPGIESVKKTTCNISYCHNYNTVYKPPHTYWLIVQYISI